MSRPDPSPSAGQRGPPSDESARSLRLAFFLNFGFTLLEIAGGFWTNSIAILTDAVHDLGDSLSLGLAWWLERFSRRGRTARQTYGHRRFRILGGLITGIVLLAGLSFVIWHAVGRLFQPAEVHVPGMMALALLGLLFNGAAVLRLKRGTSLTEKLVSWHLLEDTLGWAAVLVGAIVMAVWHLPVIDPLLSLGISGFVLANVVRHLKKVFDVLLQAAPEGFDADSFADRVRELPGIESVHHVHSWTIDGERHVLSAHLVIRESDRAETARLKEQVRALLDLDTFEHVTLETEIAGETCPQDPEP